MAQHVCTLLLLSMAEVVDSEFERRAKKASVKVRQPHLRRDLEGQPPSSSGSESAKSK